MPVIRAFKLLGQALIDKAAPHAASALGVAGVSYANGVFSGGGKSIGLTELAKKLAPAAGAAQSAGQPAVHPLDCAAEGTFGADGIFTADTVLAKHDENYMPKEVADALKEKGVWQGQ